MITIIVLLILAGVALVTLTGQGNIIGNAENAVGQYNNSVSDEQQLLNEIEKYFQNYLEGGNPPTPSVDEDGLATENTTIKPDPNSNLQITIPAGFAPAILATGTTQSLPRQDGSVASIMPADEWNNITVEDINKGIVIVDNAITYDGGNLSGTTPDFNEYVWVPIPNPENFKSTAWTTKYGYDANGDYVSGTGVTHPIAIEPTTDEEKQNKYWDDSETSEYTNMKASVDYYKGFYIGRYEASEGTGSIAQSKRDQPVWRYVTLLEAIKACTNNTKTANMHLIYGIEWDSTLNWLKDNATISSSNQGKTKTMTIDDIQTDSSSWGNYWNLNSGYIENTGYNASWKANNIYDLAGNAYELTQEKYSAEGYSSNRGGYYTGVSLDGPVANRGISGGERLRFPYMLFCNSKL